MRRLLCLFAAFTLTASTASARVRLWENNKEDPEKLQYIEVGGFLQPGFIIRQDDLNSPATDTSFWLQRARMNMRLQMHPLFSAQFELEMSGSVALQDAFVESRVRPWLQFRAGQFQLAFLRTFQFNESNLAFIDRSIFVNQEPDRKTLRYLSPRDVGFMVTGLIGNTAPEAKSPVLEYWVGAFVGNGANQTRNDDRAFLYSARLQLHLFGVPKGVAAESDISRNETPKVAVAGAVYTNCDNRAQFNRGFTVDSELRYKGLFASAAFVWFKNGPSDGLGQALGYAKDKCTGVDGVPPYIARGASAQLQYVLPPSFLPVGNNLLELLGRFDWVYPNSLNILPDNYMNDDNPPARARATFGLNWFPGGQQTLRLSFNYQLNILLQHFKGKATKADGTIESGVEISELRNNIAWLQLTASL